MTSHSRVEAYSLPVHHPTKQGCEEFSTAPVEQGLSKSLYLSLEEWPRLPFTTRVERYTWPLQACSFSR
jgi:hypothetical protein